MAQPPLSLGLQRLERTLGVQLFERTSRGMTLSTHGRDLLPRARALLEDEAALRRAATRLAQGRARLRVGMVPEVGVRRGAAVVAALTESLDSGDREQALATAPTTEPSVTLTTGPSLRLVDAVIAGTLDVVVVAHPCVLGSLVDAAVVELPTRLAVPLTHPCVAAGGPVPIPELAGLRPVLPPRSHNPAAHDTTLDQLRERGCDREPVEVDHTLAAAAVVAAGHGFLLSPDADIAVPGVAPRELAGAPLPLRVHVAYHPSRAEPATAQTITAALDLDGCPTGAREVRSPT